MDIFSEQVALVPFSRSREIEPSCKINSAFDNFFTIYSIIHVNLVYNQAKMVLGASKNKTENKEKNGSHVSNN